MCNGSVFDAIDTIKIVNLYLINNNDIASLNKMPRNVYLLFSRNSIIGFSIFRKKYNLEMEFCSENIETRNSGTFYI